MTTVVFVAVLLMVVTPTALRLVVIGGVGNTGGYRFKVRLIVSPGGVARFIPSLSPKSRAMMLAL